MKTEDAENANNRRYSEPQARQNQLVQYTFFFKWEKVVYKLFESWTPKFGLGLLFLTEEESRTPTLKILVRTLAQIFKGQ